MAITELTIQHFRNLASTTLHPHAEWNLISGVNASGKTSLLESIYFLGRGRSFRAKNTAELIQHQKDHCLSTSLIQTDHQTVRVGIQRDKQKTSVRINGENAQSAILLAQYLPVLFIGPDIYKIITEGPNLRRRYIDWGVFHLNSQFVPHWQRYQHALKQRNTLLRQYTHPPDSIQSWHQAMQISAEEIDIQREEFVLMLNEALEDVLSILAPDIDLSIQYKRGWQAEQSLYEILQRDWTSDQQYGHTRSGPHRADLVLKVEGKPASERLSQGQRKLVSIAMLIAQSYVYSETTHQPLVLLVDDLPAELDKDNRNKVLGLFAQLNAQRFISTTHASDLDLIHHFEHHHYAIDQGEISLEH